MREEKTSIRLRYLMWSRVAIVTLLLGIAAFMEIKGQDFLPEISLPSLYFIIIISYLLSLLYFFLFHFIEKVKFTLYLQVIGDVLLITGLVYATGGISSVYAVFYPLVIIYSVLFLERRGGLITASASGIFYGLLLDLEYYGILTPLSAVGLSQEHTLTAGYVFSRIIIYILSFYLVAFLAIFVVEQEKKARTLLEEKETAFDQLDLLHRSIIESVDTGILTINLRGEIKSFNRAAEEITGYSFAEMEDRNILNIFPAYGELIEYIHAEGNTNPAKSRVEMYIENKGGKPLTLGCSLSFLNDGKGKRIGAVLVFQDLTAIKSMELTLEKNRRLAFIGEMAAGLAHEMRNPLASISGSIQVLNKSLSLNETDSRLMQIILRGKDQLESFMRDFLLLSRPTPGTAEKVRVTDIIEDVLEAIRYLPDWRHDIEVVKSLRNDVPVICANKTEIRQLIWNLLINAVQAMPDGGRLTIEAGQSSENESPPCLQIRVSDTGQGIMENDRGKIFEPFYTTKEKGTGLGLAIVNRIVDSHGGQIQVDSKPGEGTAIRVRLPYVTEEKR